MTHLSDGALLLVHDGETWDERAAEWQEHLRSCLSCRARLEQIRDTLDFVAHVLTEADIAVPRTRRKRKPRAMVFAAAAILIAVSICFTPVSGWVVQQSRSIWGVDDSESVDPEEVSAAREPTGMPAGSVSFVPADAVFTLEVESWQVGGALTIRAGDYGAVTATMTGSNDRDNLLVLPSGLRVVNVPSSTNEYLILLPSSIERIELTLPDTPPTTLTPSGVAKEWAIPLVRR